jgi:hypothetical protein
VQATETAAKLHARVEGRVDELHPIVDDEHVAVAADIDFSRYEDLPVDRQIRTAQTQTECSTCS